MSSFFDMSSENAKMLALLRVKSYFWTTRSYQLMQLGSLVSMSLMHQISRTQKDYTERLWKEDGNQVSRAHFRTPRKVSPRHLGRKGDFALEIDSTQWARKSECRGFLAS